MAGEIDKGSAQLILLKEINEAANRGEALSKILQKAVEGVAEIFNYPACDIFLLEEEDVLRYANITLDSKIIRAAEKITGITVDGYRIKLFEGSCFKEVIDTKAPVILDDMVRIFEGFAGGDPKLTKAAPAVAKIAGFKWVIRVPLLSNNRVLGILGAATNKDLADVDIPALELFASNLAVIIERKQMEDMLRESEEKYRLIVNSSHTGIYILQDGLFKFANETMCRITGYTREELIGMSFEDLIAPESRKVIAEGYKRQRGQAGPAYVEFKGLCKDGSVRDALTYSVPITYQGRPASQGNLIDITERKKTEDSLKESEEKYRSLVESSHTGIYIIQDGILRFVNQKLCEIAGYSKDELLGSNFERLIAPESKGVIAESYKRQSGETGPAYFEFKGLRKDGGLRDVISYSVPIRYQGRPAVQGNLIDITERKRAEEQIKELMELNENIIESAPSAIHFIDRDFVVQSWNSFCERYIHIDKADIIGKNLFEAIPSLRKLGWDKIYERVLETGTTFEKRGYKITRTFGPCKGEEWYQNLNVVPVRKDGKIIGAVTIIEDVTDLQQAQNSLIGLLEEIKESNKMLESANIRLHENDRLKSIFLATVSHELRTPLNAIIGFTGLMLQGRGGELGSEQKKQLEIVNSNARHLRALIEDLLDISKIEAGRILVEPTEFDLQKAIGEVAQLFTSKTREKGIRIVEKTSKIVVHSDVKRFKQVLTNLVDNAVKFTVKGEITLSACIEDSSITVVVEDTGIGIKAEDVPLLFQSFQRVNPPIDSVTEGSGLGLYLSQKIANMLGGEITVTSTFNKGSIFTLKIPADISQSVR
ncbi:signal transduction histidine-protein kinase BarA [archaeon BMS3Abin16]|nr:signal transduction histidine-protein kinase BarA [archaeon BMS3Abin16]